MSYYSIGFDTRKSAFVSLKGDEETVTFTPEEGCKYYVADDSNIVVKLICGWISATNIIGEVLSKQGELVTKIPHPGKKHGDISTNGIVSGDSKGFKLVIEPYDNSNSYFLYFNLSNGEFSGAGNAVR
jgi:hypothetical protein